MSTIDVRLALASMEAHSECFTLRAFWMMTRIPVQVQDEEKENDEAEE